MQWEISSLQKKKLRLSSGVPINIKYLIILFVKTVPSYSHEYTIPCWYGSSKTKATLKNICNTCRPNRLKPPPRFLPWNPPLSPSYFAHALTPTPHVTSLRSRSNECGQVIDGLFSFHILPHRTAPCLHQHAPHHTADSIIRGDNIYFLQNEGLAIPAPRYIL